MSISVSLTYGSNDLGFHNRTNQQFFDVTCFDSWLALLDSFTMIMTSLVLLDLLGLPSKEQQISPYLSSIKHLWEYLDRRVRQRHQPPTTLQTGSFGGTSHRALSRPSLNLLTDNGNLQSTLVDISQNSRPYWQKTMLITAATEGHNSFRCSPLQMCYFMPLM